MSDVAIAVGLTVVTALACVGLVVVLLAVLTYAKGFCA